MRFLFENAQMYCFILFTFNYHYGSQGRTRRKELLLLMVKASLIVSTNHIDNLAVFLSHSVGEL